ncbi:MAG: AraC family transcriptional regulator [Kofleriaceae bacterium]
MYVATTSRAFGRHGRFAVTIALGPALSAAMVHRRGLVYASRFVPPLPRSRSRALLYVLLAGRLRVDGVVHAAPSAVLLDEDAFEGQGARTAVDWVNVGEPLQAVELRFPRARLRVAPGPSWRPPAELPAAAATAFDGEHGVWALEQALVDAGVLAARPSVPEPRTHRRLWSAVEPLARAFNLLGSLDELAAGAGVSSRHASRDLGEFIRSVTVPFEGWRESTRRLRLKMAVMGLSAADLPISELARGLGYGSVDAMSRAFRDAGQPSPTEVRARLRELGDALAAR